MTDKIAMVAVVGEKEPVFGEIVVAVVVPKVKGELILREREREREKNSPTQPHPLHRRDRDDRGDQSVLRREIGRL